VRLWLPDAVEELLLRALGIGWVVSIALPLVLLGLSMVAKCWSVPGRATRAEYAVGLELLFAAVASQLAALSILDDWPEDTMVQAEVQLGLAMLPALSWLILGVVIYLHRWGHDDRRQPRVLEGVVLPVSLGLATVIVVFALNFRPLGA
jgi:hypothetical protein